jgi:hypothetical protein
VPSYIVASACAGPGRAVWQCFWGAAAAATDAGVAACRRGGTHILAAAGRSAKPRAPHPPDALFEGKDLLQHRQSCYLQHLVAVQGPLITRRTVFAVSAIGESYGIVSLLPEKLSMHTVGPQAALQYRRTVRRALLYTAAGAGAGLAAYFGWRWYNTHYGSGGSGSSGSGDSLAESKHSAPRGAQ